MNIGGLLSTLEPKVASAWKMLLKLPPLYKTSHILLAWSHWLHVYNVQSVKIWLGWTLLIGQLSMKVTWQARKSIVFKSWCLSPWKLIYLLSLQSCIIFFSFSKEICLTKSPFWLSKTKMLSLKNVLCLVVNLSIVYAKAACRCRLIAAVKMWLKEQAWTIFFFFHVFLQLTVICSSALCLATLLFYTVIT